MGRIPIRVDANALEQIRTMAMDGRSRKQIASKTGLSEGVVKWQMDKNGIPLQTSRLGIKKKKKQIDETGEYFDYKNFPHI